MEQKAGEQLRHVATERVAFHGGIVRFSEHLRYALAALVDRSQVEEADLTGAVLVGATASSRATHIRVAAMD
jgi:hypothetical protein